MFIRKKHFIKQIYTLRIALFLHITLLLFYATWFTFSLRYLSNYYVAYYTYSVLLFMLMVLYFGYRYKFNHIKRNLYTVVFSKRNNRETWNAALEGRKLACVDISGGYYSFVSKIHFTKLCEEEIQDLIDEFSQNSDLVHPIATKRAFYILTLHMFLSVLSISTLVAFFTLIPVL